MEIIGPYTPWEPPHEIDNVAHQSWYKNGDRHRENGPAVILKSGFKSWWINGKRHREDGPAVIHQNGDKSWWINGKRHREDGPAVIHQNGDKSWYMYNKNITMEVKQWAEKCDIDIDNISDSDKLLLKTFVSIYG
jgi:hypothetical protein